MPVILRPSPDTENYALIGECFVSGIMYGELQSMDPSLEQVLQEMVIV